MTYFNFLLVFIVPPCLALLALVLWEQRRMGAPAGWRWGRWLWLGILAHVLLAVAYTTPWDNYLVANHIWSYDPALVSGVVLGYVPLEEYCFFVLETLLSGLWWAVVARRVGPDRLAGGRRWPVLLALGAGWLCSLAVLFSGWQPGTYLAITLAWALPPIALQVVAGADTLWGARRLIAWSVAPLTIYLSVADALAIRSGTWTIDPAHSTGLFFGALPLEEAVFFLVTNVLIVFGMTLVGGRRLKVEG